ncbi:hypothetical protein B5E41_20145 [Rhizobium esperanzae]|uniref:Uncharacterized protein n=1 Tax=Rhizobium esperanzae TaxID=1967781 RepID=A0A246DUB4_9HYPH|nr:hypothetical protein [Rhizobium esperanzae]OWO93116.1 hypothetical protein B5E41_20145 [Rhizobium esperanzae]
MIKIEFDTPTIFSAQWHRPEIRPFSASSRHPVNQLRDIPGASMTINRVVVKRSLKRFGRWASEDGGECRPA